MLNLFLQFYAENANATFVTFILFLVSFSLGYPKVLYIIRMDGISLPVASRLPLRLRVLKYRSSFVGFIGPVVSLDYHFQLSSFFTT